MSEAALNKSLDDLIKEQRDKRRRPAKKRNNSKTPNKKVENAVKVQSGSGTKVKSERRGGGHRAGGVGGGKPAVQQQGIHKASTKLTTAPIVVKAVVPRHIKQKQKRQAIVTGSVGTEHPPRLTGGAFNNPIQQQDRRPAPAPARTHEQHSVDHDRKASPYGTKLYISNLDQRVSRKDIKELFESIGPLHSYGIHVNPTGRSRGTAEVVFFDRAHAEVARKRYHNVELDGRPMHIELFDKKGGNNAIQTLGSGIKVSSGSGVRILEVPRMTGQRSHPGSSRMMGGSLRRGNRRDTMQMD